MQRFATLATTCFTLSDISASQVERLLNKVAGSWRQIRLTEDVLNHKMMVITPERDYDFTFPDALPDIEDVLFAMGDLPFPNHPSLTLLALAPSLGAAWSLNKVVAKNVRQGCWLHNTAIWIQNNDAEYWDFHPS